MKPRKYSSWSISWRFQVALEAVDGDTRIGGGAGQGDACSFVEQRAGRQETRGLHRIQRGQHAGRQHEATAHPVGLADQHGADDQVQVSDRKAVADLQAQAVEDGLLDQRPGDTVPGRQSGGDAGRAGDLDLARQRIVRRDAAQFDQTTVPRRRLSHRPRPGGIGDLALVCEGGLLGGGKAALADADADVAAQDFARLGGEPLAEGFSGRSGGGDGCHAQRQASQEDAKARHARAQFAHRKAKAEHQTIRPSAMTT